MMKKIPVYIIASMLFFTILGSNVNATIDKITLIDGTDDITKIEAEAGNSITNISRPNIDIYKLTLEQSGKEVKLTLQLKEGGIFTKPESYTDIFIYMFGVITSHNSYTITFEEAKEIGEEPPLSIEAENLFSSETNEITGDYEGVNTNKLTVSFSLLKEDEKIISCCAVTTTMETSLMTIYVDKVNVNPEEIEEELIPFPLYPWETLFLLINDKEEPVEYKVKTGETVNFNGNLKEELNPEDCEWLWVIVNKANYRTAAMLKGQNNQYSFNIPGNYTGILFVYNDTGSYGMIDFHLEVSGKETNGDGQEEEPIGGNLITFILIILVIIIVGVAVVLLFLRKR